MTQGIQRRAWTTVMSVLTLIGLLATPFATRAANTAYTTDTTLFMSGPGITLTILAGSKSESLVVTTTTFTVDVALGDTFTIRYPSPNPGTLANDGGLPACNLVSGHNEVTVTGSDTVTFTPNTTPCGSGGGGGGGGSSPPTVAVVQPNGGERLTGNSNYNVVWSSGGTGVTSYRVSFSTNGGATWNVAVSGTSGSFYVWSVPNVSTASAKVRVEGLNSSNAVVVTDDSNATFTITPTSSPPSAPSQPEGTGTSSSGQGAMSRAQANSKLPSSAQVDFLVKLANDNNAATEVDSTVYYIGLDAKRHPFISSVAYLSWYADFSGVTIIDAASLASIPLGKPTLVRPGTHWVKITSDPKTYYVEPGYKLRWIKDEATAIVFGGPNWNKNVVDVDVSFFLLFSAGADIDLPYLQNSWPSGALVKSSNAAMVWYIQSANKRNIVSMAAFEANQFQLRFVDTDTARGWQNLPEGTLITGQEDGLFSLLH